MRLSLSFVGMSAAVALAACGISVIGEAPDEEGGRDAATDGWDGKKDGTGPVERDASPDACPAPSCSLPVPPTGWSLVVFGAASDTCPAGFDGQGAIEGPSAKDACTCGACAITKKSDCTGQVRVDIDNGVTATCTTPSTPVNGGVCLVPTDRGPAHVRFTPPPPVPGVCNAPVMADKSKVTSQSKRICGQQAGACLDSACKLAGSAKACIAQPGAVDCPTAMPDKHVVGDDFTLSCAACGCTVSATCSGAMEFYKENSCTGAPTGTILPGSCTNLPFMGPVNSYKWKGTASEDTCNVEAAPGAVALTGTRTICCP